MNRILLGQLDSNGDCYYATILARQIRNDYPNAHVTWAISSGCANVALNNPDIDEVWEIPIAVGSQGDRERAWYAFEREAFRRYRRGEFDHVVLSQINPSYFHNFDGTIRPSILRSYGRPITVPIENVIRLTSDEINHAEHFVKTHDVAKFENRFLFECSSRSGQSFVTPDLAQDIAQRIYEILPDSTVIFLTNLPMTLRDARSRYAGDLSLRECAHLTHHCNVFLGSGSGGTVTATSTAARSLPMMLMLSGATSVFASFEHDFEYFGLTGREILETSCEDPSLLAQCAATIRRKGTKQARETIPSGIPVFFDMYFNWIESFLIRRDHVVDAVRSVAVTAARYGWTMELLEFVSARVLPHLEKDPDVQFLNNRQFVEEFVEHMAAAAIAPQDRPCQKPGAGVGHATPKSRGRFSRMFGLGNS